MNNAKKNIGIEVELPKQKCDDKKCPFHGDLKIRKNTIKGIIISTDTHKSARLEIQKKRFVSKYERYEKMRIRIGVHNPPCINSKKGDIVIAAQCRPLSKSKTFVIIKNIGKDELFKQKEEALEESKVKVKEEELKDNIKEETKE